MELTGLFDKNQNLQGYHRELSADPAIQGGLRKIDLGRGFLYNSVMADRGLLLVREGPGATQHTVYLSVS